ncbi:hypothetical protein [Streptomyces sp. NPDC020298]|uniref:hypothetical protein n=1 Tax=unclassified Streptomyces TaxID=2593676 RepID=UPI0033F48A24
MSDTVRVGLSDDYYLGEQFVTEPQSCWSEENVYEVPREQAERWQAAESAWAEAQEEMGAVMGERRQQRNAARAESQRREDERRAEIRRGLYSGRKR